MQNTIYYFTGTGNSLFIARKIAEKLGNTELVNIKDAIKNNTPQPNSQSIGIVFPVYAFGAPLIVMRFLRGLKISSDKYVFIVCNSASGPGIALNIAETIIKKNGISVSASFSLKMPGNYIPFYGAIAKEKQDKLFAAAEKKIESLAEIVKNARKGHSEKANSIFYMLLNPVFKRLVGKRWLESDKKYWTNEKCNSCGTCVKVCPVENISLENGRPVWHRHCEQCMACLQWCPQEAVEYGKISIGRKRYRQPDTSLKDFFRSE